MFLNAAKAQFSKTVLQFKGRGLVQSDKNKITCLHLNNNMVVTHKIASMSNCAWGPLLLMHLGGAMESNPACFAQVGAPASRQK